jgi:hypothetical protein
MPDMEDFIIIYILIVTIWITFFAYEWLNKAYPKEMPCISYEFSDGMG